MKICLISSENGSDGGIGYSRRRMASLLASRHEVTLIHSGGIERRRWTAADSGVRELFVEPTSHQERTVFCGHDHRLSAAVLETIEHNYEDGGPDYVEVPDYRAHGLVPMQARRAGHPLLRETLFAAQLCSSAELVFLHDRNHDDPERRLLGDLEREQFRLADRIVWRGGDTLDLYRRYYPFELPEAVRIRAPYKRPVEPPRAQRRKTDGPLRLLCVGRLQRFKGAVDLAEACLRLPRDDWELTMIGRDTPSAPTGQSVRETIEAMFDGDPRLSIEEPLEYDELQQRWAEYDLLVVPSRFEVWSNVTVEAMRAGLPVLATPVGGPAELVAPGITGWHSDDLGSRALGRALLGLLEDREEVERVRASGAIYERFLEFSDPEPILDAYERMFEAARPPASMRSGRRTAVTSEPLVTGVVPYYRTPEYVRDAVDSLLAQTHRNLEVLIVNDGSFEEEDAILDELPADSRVRVVTQLNAGESAARNLGARLARGEYVAMLDADNVLEPDFVARALEIFASEPELAYVSCWLRFVDPDGSPHQETAGYAPLGNRVVRDDVSNWDGDTVAVLPRRLFSDLGYGFEPASGIQSDWELYRWLGEDGRFGIVIPDWLVRYRVLAGSVMRAHGSDIHKRSWEEALARKQLRSTRWIAGV
jgi:glycosyltransferase involved in cell wall biosynthesis